MPTNNNPLPPANVEAAAPVAEPEWNGYTIDELQRLRAKALVKRELGRMQLLGMASNMQQSVQNNGMRGLLFNKNQVLGLKKADYMLLAFKATRLLAKWWLRRR